MIICVLFSKIPVQEGYYLRSGAAGGGCERCARLALGHAVFYRPDNRVIAVCSLLNIGEIAASA